MKLEKLSTVSQAAKALNISRGTIRRNIRNGLWPSFRLGPKSTRVNVEEIKKIARTSDAASAHG